MEEIYDDDEFYPNPLEGTRGGVYESPEQARLREMSINCAVLGLGLMFIGSCALALIMLLEYFIPSGKWYETIEAVGRAVVGIIAFLSLSSWVGCAVYHLRAKD